MQSSNTLIQKKEGREGGREGRNEGRGREGWWVERGRMKGKEEER